MKNEKYLEDKIKEVTKEEVKNIFLTEFDVQIMNYSEYDLPYSNLDNENYKVQSEIDSYGGEGQGEEYWTISRILNKRTNEVFFIKFDAYYNSWEGTDWSDNNWRIVKPNEVKVVQWN